MTRGMVIFLLAIAVMAKAQAQMTTGRSITFDAVTAEGTALALQGRLFEPDQPANTAVVLLHSSGGLQDARDGHYGKVFSEAGFLVLAVDSFTPRGIIRTTDNQSQAGSIQMAKDALDARKFLQSKYGGLKKFVVMGFSKGGLAALFTADKTFFPNEDQRFDAHIAFYPSCAFRAKNPKPNGPIHMFIGEKDDFSGVTPCVEWGEAYAMKGGSFEYKTYKDAHHTFDGAASTPQAHYLPRAENFLNCLVLVSDDGQWEYNGKTYPTQLSTYPDLSRTCIKKGATIGTNLSAKEAATADALAIIRKVSSGQ